MKYKYKDLHLYKELHQKRSYGDTGSGYANDINAFISETKSSDVLDFGSGAGSLKKSLAKLGVFIDEFDPCVSGKNIIPKTQYDLIVTTDVLEHIYEDELANLFDEILSLTPKFMYHGISTRPATIMLPDGSNAHKTIQSANWWYNKINEIISPQKIEKTEPSIDCVILKVFL